MAPTNIGFRPHRPGFAEQIQDRTSPWVDSPGKVAQRDLSRYYTLLDAELATVAAQLTPAEALALCDVLQGTHVGDDPASMGLLIRHLDSEITDSAGLADKWDIDAEALVALVQGWTLGQRLAVVDAVERWWTVGAEQEPALRAVGLIPAEGALPARQPPTQSFERR